MSQSFNYISISTRLLLKCESASIKRRRAWKLINMKIIIDMLSNWDVNITQSNFIDEINDRITKMQNLLSKIIDIVVFWAKSNLHVKLYWSQKCINAVNETKRLHQMWSHKSLSKIDKRTYKVVIEKKKSLAKSNA